MSYITSSENSVIFLLCFLVYGVVCCFGLNNVYADYNPEAKKATVVINGKEILMYEIEANKILEHLGTGSAEKTIGEGDIVKYTIAADTIVKKYDFLSDLLKMLTLISEDTISTDKSGIVLVKNPNKLSGLKYIAVNVKHDPILVIGVDYDENT